MLFTGTEYKRCSDGGVEWEGIDEVFSFVYDTLDLYMEMSSMQLDIGI